MVDRVITRGRPYALYIMVHVRSLRTCPVLAEASFVAFTLAAKWRFVLFTFVDDSLLDLAVRCKDRDLRCTRHRRCRLAGGTDRNSL